MDIIKGSEDNDRYYSEENSMEEKEEASSDKASSTEPTSNLTDLSDDELVSKAKEYAKKVSDDQQAVSKEAESAFLLASEKKSTSERVLKEAEDIFSSIDGFG